MTHTGLEQPFRCLDISVTFCNSSITSKAQHKRFHWFCGGQDSGGQAGSWDHVKDIPITVCLYCTMHIAQPSGQLCTFYGSHLLRSWAQNPGKQNSLSKMLLFQLNHCPLFLVIVFTTPRTMSTFQFSVICRCLTFLCKTTGVSIRQSLTSVVCQESWIPAEEITISSEAQPSKKFEPSWIFFEYL